MHSRYRRGSFCSFGGRLVKLLESAASGRDNNLNLLRCIAAADVVYAHAYGMSHSPVQRDG